MLPVDEITISFPLDRAIETAAAQALTIAFATPFNAETTPTHVIATIFPDRRTAVVAVDAPALTIFPADLTTDELVDAVTDRAKATPFLGSTEPTQETRIEKKTALVEVTAPVQSTRRACPVDRGSVVDDEAPTAIARATARTIRTPPAHDSKTLCETALIVETALVQVAAICRRNACPTTIVVDVAHAAETVLASAT